MTALSKAWLCGHSISGTAGSNPAGGMDVSVVSVVYCQVEVYARGGSVVQRSPTVCVCVCVCVSE